MFGKFNLTIDEAIAEYTTFVREVYGCFVIRRWQRKLVRKYIVRDILFDHINLERLFKQLTKKYTGYESTVMADVNNPCKFATIACDGDDFACSVPKIFRSYDSSEELADQCHIWQAARASTADPKYFKPYMMGGAQYADGVQGFANPCEIVLEEASELFVGCRINILNLGAGCNKDYGYRDMLKCTRAIPERVEEPFRNVSMYLEGHGNAWRLNVASEGRKVWQEQIHKISVVEKRTRNYLNSREVSNQVWDIV